MKTFKQFQEKLSDKEYKEVDALLNRDALLRGNLIKNYTQRGKFETMKARDTFRRIKKNKDGKLRIDRGTEEKIKVNRHTVSKNFPELSKKPAEKYQKYYRLPEAAMVIPAAGVISKVLPAAAATIGAIGTLKDTLPTFLQARKYKTRNNPSGRVGIGKKDKRKIGNMEKEYHKKERKKEVKQSNRDDDMIVAKQGEAQKQNKLIDKYIKKQKSRKPFDPVKSEPTIEKPPTLTGRVDKTKGAPTPKRTTFKKANQFEDVVPTNNVGGGQIAGTVEAGDDPPVKKKKKKKKKYIYGGRGSRKMWMNNK
jgi:hypothetical protein